MNLKSFGCSFIYGTELADASSVPGNLNPSKLTWVSHMAQQHGYEYQCYARPGSGNLQIAERVLSHAIDTDNSLFVIGWTWIDRFDYTHLTISNDPIASTWNNWHTIMPVDETVLAKTYYQELHTEYRDKLTTLMSIRLVIDTLRQKNIPFIMTYMDDLMFDQRWNTTPAVIDLQEYIKPYMTTFDNHTFVDWSKKNGYPITKIGHPLEEAHAAAGDYMIKVFDKQNTSGLTRWVLS
jgi:hypothetical protein